MTEHVGAMRRHMENTSQYLRKEVKEVENKIKEAKEIMLKNIGVNLDEFDTPVLDTEQAKAMLHKEILEDEAEDYEEDEKDSTLILP
jgi:hypothetical protein